MNRSALGVRSLADQLGELQQRDAALCSVEPN
jgi:hypothetical protein